MPLPRLGLPVLALLTLFSLPPVHAEPSAAPPGTGVPVRQDLAGDPLPPGAIARLGTVRLRHGEVVLTVAFSPDGKTLASAGMDSVLRLWETATGRLLHALRDHTNPVTGVAFAPDGKTLVSSGWDNTLRFWDVTTGKSLRVIKERRASMSCLAFAPDGKTVATAGRDGTVRLWDPATGAELRRCTGHSGDIRHLCFSPDGKMLASGGLDRTVRFWDSDSGSELGKLQAPPLRAGTGAVCPVAFSPDGKKFAVAFLGRKLAVYDGSVAKELATVNDIPGEIRSLAFTPDSRTLVTAGSAHGAQRWDAATLRKLGSYGSTREVACVAFHGPTLVTGESNAIRLWDTASGKELPRGNGHRDRILSLAFLDKGKYLATGGGDGTLRVWDPQTGREVRQLPHHPGAVQALAFEPKAGLLASASTDAVVRLWHPDRDEKPQELAGKDLGIFALAFSHDGTTLAVGSRATAVRLWDIAAGREIRSLGSHPRGGVQSLAFTPEGKTLVSAGGSGHAIFFWDVATGALRHQMEGSHGPVTAALSSDGKTLATTAMSKVRLWEMDMVRKLAELTADPFLVHSLAFSPDGKLLATGGKNASVRLWDWANRKELNNLSGHEGAVLAVAFSPDGHYLASAAADGVALVWDVAEVLKNPPQAPQPSSKPPGRERSQGTGSTTSDRVSLPPSGASNGGGRARIPRSGGVDVPPALPSGALARLGNSQFRHGGAVQTLAFSRDGSLLAAAGVDGTVRLWDAASGTERRRFAAGTISVNELFFTTEDKWLMAVGLDSVRAWKASDGTEAARLGGDRSLAGPLAVSPDGALVAVSAGERFSDSRIRIRSVVNGKSLKLLEGHTAGLLALCFSPDGTTLASASSDETIRLWDIASGKEKTQWTGHDRGARRLVFSPNGKMLVSVGLDGVVRLWDVASGKNVQTLRAILGFGRTAVFAPDSKTLALGLANGTIQIVDCDDGKISRSWQSVSIMVTALAFSGDGKTLAAGFLEGPIRFYDAATGQERFQHQGLLKAIRKAVYLPDNNTLATLGGDGRVRLWDLRSHQEVRSLDPPENRGSLACLSGDGRSVITVNKDETLSFWNDGKLEMKWKTKKPVRPAALALSADAKLLASSQPDRFVHLENTQGKELRKFRGLRTPASRLAFSPDSRMLAGQIDRYLLLWDVEGQEPSRTLDLRTPLNCELIFAPDSLSLATLAGDNVVRLWEVASGQVRASFAGHPSGVSAAAFSADGKLLITAGQDRTLRSWDLATGESLHRLEQAAVATALACSPDGRTVASGNNDTTTLIWDAARFRRHNERPTVRLDQATIDRLWTELASDNAARAYEAKCRLAGSPRQAVALMKERLQEQLDEEQKHIRELLVRLDGEQFSERERAGRALLRLGRRAEAPLRKILSGNSSAELRRRASDLLEKLRAPENRTTPALTLTSLRCVELLERLDTSEARAVLKEWADASADEPRTQAAKASLARLAASRATTK